jgi:hypothetical protein
MRKFAIFCLIILVATVVASIYGVGHDQVTYSISPEYYTKFKFIQFNLADSAAAQHMTQPRSAVVLTGVKATWWMGVLIGVVLGLVGFIFPDADTMFSYTLRALGWVLLITIIAGVVGGLYGHNVLAGKGVSWWMPSDLKDRTAYITVGSIHNFSYVGGMVGLFVGIVFLVLRKRLIIVKSAE